MYLGGEHVEDADAVAIIQQRIRQVGADETGPTGNQHTFTHARPSPSLLESLHTPSHLRCHDNAAHTLRCLDRLRIRTRATDPMRDSPHALWLALTPTRPAAGGTAQLASGKFRTIALAMPCFPGIRPAETAFSAEASPRMAGTSGSFRQPRHER